MKGTIRFGPAGIPLGCDGDNVDGVRYTGSIGLSAYEVEFVRGVRMNSEMARAMKEESRRLDVRLSAHCPYWINCCPKEREKRDMTVRNLIQTARAMDAMGGGVIVFHPGFYMGRPPEVCFALAKDTLAFTLEKMKEGGIRNVVLGAETVGKKAQFGGLDENIRLAQELPGLVPVIDFAHVHAREGGWIKKKEHYRQIFDKLEAGLGRKAVEGFHSHFSELEYTHAGERMHLELGTNNEPPFAPLAELLAEQGYAGTIICETPLLEQDALRLKEMYEKKLKK